MKNVTPQELEAAVDLVRSDNGQPRLHTVRDVLEARKLGIIGVMEARILFGLSAPEVETKEPIKPSGFWARLFA